MDPKANPERRDWDPRPGDEGEAGEVRADE